MLANCGNEQKEPFIDLNMRKMLNCTTLYSKKTTCVQSRAEQRSVYKQKFLKTNKKFHYRTEKIVNFQIVNELKELLRKKTNGKLFRTNGKF